MATKTTSAGGVLVRGSGDTRTVLIGYTAYPEERWTLPKGIMKEGENPQETAIREVREETGYTGRILRELGRDQYSFTHKGTEYDKTVIYYEMTVESEVNDRDEELESVRWVSVKEAIELIPFEGERTILRQLL